MITRRPNATSLGYAVVFCIFASSSEGYSSSSEGLASSSEGLSATNKNLDSMLTSPTGTLTEV
jgi:hypothetical protein